MAQTREEKNRKRRERYWRKKQEKLEALQRAREFVIETKQEVKEEPKEVNLSCWYPSETKIEEVRIEEEKRIEKRKAIGSNRRQPLHEHFAEYTVEEIERIRQEVCVAHKCPYLSTVKGSTRGFNAHASSGQKCCNYILIAEHMRNCMPDVCEHYKDKQVKKKSPVNNMFKH